MRKLSRSNNEVMLLGVCGGMGEYFKIDPTVVRLGFVGLGLLWGYGICLYVAAAFLMPKQLLIAADSGPGADGPGDVAEKPEPVVKKKAAKKRTRSTATTRTADAM